MSRPPAGVLVPYYWLRIRSSRRVSRLIGQLFYLPRLLRRDASTVEVFTEEPLIERLAQDETALVRIGRGLTERVIEIPWTIRSLPDGPRLRVLDIGTAFSLVVYKRLLYRLAHDVELADLAPAYVPGMVSHVADVRRLPFADGDFDVAVCISTLEHVGMINDAYGVVSGGEGDVQGLRELGRVARRVLVTVPAGRDAEMGWQRQYAPPTFRHRVAEAGLRVDRLQVFAHDPASGWSPVAEDAVGERTYGEDAMAAAAVICAELSRA